ncbi:MAG: hypothetical protein GXP49_03420 [Deltaproteobacteria bacterium]|nr:hypothetical protein [Deltaproteobacteria bacterium]
MNPTTRKASRKPRGKSGKIIACLGLSGASLSIYAFIWSRLLVRVLGNGPLSIPAGIPFFLVGLALGQNYGARRSFKNPAKLSALLEIITALWAVLSFYIMTWLDPVLGFVLSDFGTTFTSLFTLFFSSLFMLLPGFGLGIALFLNASRAQSGENTGTVSPGRVLQMLFLGSAAGFYLAGFWLIPLFEVVGAIEIGAVFGLVTALLSLGLDSGAAVRNASMNVKGIKNRNRVRTLLLLVAVSGIVFSSGAMVLYRLSMVIIGETFYSAGAVLAAIAAGSVFGILPGNIIGRKLSVKKIDPIAIMAFLVLVFSLSIVPVAASLDLVQAFTAAYANAGGLTSLHFKLLAVFVIFLVPAAFFAAFLNKAASFLESNNHPKPIATETILSIAIMSLATGFVISGLVAVPVTGFAATLKMGAALASIAAATSCLLACRKHKVILSLLAISICVPVLYFTPGPPVSRLLWVLAPNNFKPGLSAMYRAVENQARSERETMYEKEGDSSIVSIRDVKPHKRALFVNGMSRGWIDPGGENSSPSDTLLAIIPALLNSRLTISRPAGASPSRAMVAGLGSGNAVRVLYALGLRKIDVIEPESAVIKAQELLSRGSFDIRHNPGTRIISEDSRYWLLKAAGQNKKYDIILLDSNSPWTSSSAALLTQEMFERCRAALASGGVFSVRVFLGRMDEDSFRSIARAFADTFPRALVFYFPRSFTAVFAGAKDSFSLDLPAASSRFKKAGLDRLESLSSRNIHGITDIIQHVIGSWTWEKGVPYPPPPPNTDANSFIEARLPLLPKWHILPLDGLAPILQRRLFNPDFLKAGTRNMQAKWLLEKLLNTPLGRIPRDISLLKMKRKKFFWTVNMLKCLKPLLSRAEFCYFMSRLDMASGHPEDAIIHLSNCRILDSMP